MGALVFALLGTGAVLAIAIIDYARELIYAILVANGKAEPEDDDFD